MPPAGGRHRDVLEAVRIAVAQAVHVVVQFQQRVRAKEFRIVLEIEKRPRSALWKGTASGIKRRFAISAANAAAKNADPSQAP